MDYEISIVDIQVSSHCSQLRVGWFRQLQVV